MTPTHARLLYVDCDTGIDDALAIAYLLTRPQVAIAGIGTVSGNIDAAAAAANTLRILSLAGRTDIPVAVGDVNRGKRAATVHGANGIGDVTLPDTGLTPIRRSASELLVYLAHKHPGELSILALGPLTNLAAALDADPHLPELIKDVTVMGGALLAPGNVTPAAEANTHNDPEAAHRVLAASWPITLIPLGLTLDDRLDLHEQQRLQLASTPLARALGAMVRHYAIFYIGTFGVPVPALHDPLATAVAIGDVVPLVAPTVHVSVDTTDGPNRGRTTADLRGRFRDYPPQQGAHCRVVLATDRPLAETLVDRLLTIPE